MRRYKLIIEYLGTNFSGWQIQPDARTVEEELEKAFSTVLQTEVDLIGQGRTDAGVHAAAQVAHVDLESEADIYSLVHGVNGLAGEEIAVLEMEEVSDDFHSRFDATAREYEYSVILNKHPLRSGYTWQASQIRDEELLHECAELILGEHDFSGFSKFNEDNFTTLCGVGVSEWEKEGDRLIYHIRANRFLRNMVRRLVGTMIRVAQGKMTLKQFEQLLNDPDCGHAAFTAPAKGLLLKKVFY